MQKSFSVLAVAALLALSVSSAEAMPSGTYSDGASGSQPDLMLVADGCGAGRFRGVGGYCQGHRPITVRKVCTVRGYPYAAVRRCHLVRM